MISTFIRILRDSAVRTDDGEGVLILRVVRRHGYISGNRDINRVGCAGLIASPARKAPAGLRRCCQLYNITEMIGGFIGDFGDRAMIADDGQDVLIL